MPSGFFILLTYFLRVDGVLIRMNGTRYHYEKGNNFILREFTTKEAKFESLRHVRYWDFWRNIGKYLILKKTEISSFFFLDFFLHSFHPPCTQHPAKSKSICRSQPKQHTNCFSIETVFVFFVILINDLYFKLKKREKMHSEFQKFKEEKWYYSKTHFTFVEFNKIASIKIKYFWFIHQRSFAIDFTIYRSSYLNTASIWMKWAAVNTQRFSKLKKMKCSPVFISRLDTINNT